MQAKLSVVNTLTMLWRPEPRRMLIAIGALVAMTLGATATPWRYQTIDPAVLENADFKQGVRHWRAPRNGVQLVPGEPPHVRVATRRDGRAGWLGRLIPRKSGYDHLRIVATAASDALTGADQTWKGGRLSVQSVDRDGKRLWYLPTDVLRLEGDNAWTRHVRIIPLSDDAKSTWLMAFAIGDSGSLRLREIGVEGLLERPAYRWSRYAIAALWMLLMAYAAWRLAWAPGRSFARLMTLATAIGVVAAATVPQPHLNNLLHDSYGVVNSAWTAIAAKHSAWQTEVSPPAKNQSDQGSGPDTATADGAAKAKAARKRKRKQTQARASGKSKSGANGRTRAPLRLPVEASDKLAHVLAFATLGLFAFASFRAMPALLIGVTLLTVSALVQVAQMLSQTRDADFFDFAHDCLGITIGALLAFALLKTLRSGVRWMPSSPRN